MVNCSSQNQTIGPFIGPDPHNSPPKISARTKSILPDALLLSTSHISFLRSPHHGQQKWRKLTIVGIYTATIHLSRISVADILTILPSTSLVEAEISQGALQRRLGYSPSDHERLAEQGAAREVQCEKPILRPQTPLLLLDASFS